MEHLYIISYDISQPKRWRRVFKIMKGYGEWLQLSVFQCRLSKTRVLQLEAERRSMSMLTRSPFSEARVPRPH